MFMLGAGVLGNLNKDSMGQKALGMTFWRIVLSAGILGLVMSLINLAAVSWLPFCWLYQDHTNHFLRSELYFCRPGGRRERTPSSSRRSCRPPKSNLADQQPSIIQTQPETRRDPANVQSSADEKIAVYTKHNPLPVEDLESHGSQWCVERL